MNATKEPEWRDVVTQSAALIDDGREYQRMARYEDALAWFDKAVNLCRGLSDKVDPVALALAQALDNKGLALMDLERLTEAIPCFDEGIRIHEGFVRGNGSQQDAREIAVSAMNKGLALMRLNRDDEARACFERAIDSFEECESIADLARAWLNLGELYGRQHRLKESLAAYEQAVAAWKLVTAFDLGTFKFDAAYTLYCQADALYRLERYHGAFDATDLAVTMLRAIVEETPSSTEREGLADTLKLHGDILTKLGCTKEAKKYFCEAAKLKGQRDARQDDAD